jgi:hypothetical protein
LLIDPELGDPPANGEPAGGYKTLHDALVATIVDLHWDASFQPSLRNERRIVPMHWTLTGD